MSHQSKISLLYHRHFCSNGCRYSFPTLGFWGCSFGLRVCMKASLLSVKGLGLV